MPLLSTIPLLLLTFILISPGRDLSLIPIIDLFCFFLHWPWIKLIRSLCHLYSRSSIFSIWTRKCHIIFTLFCIALMRASKKCIYALPDAIEQILNHAKETFSFLFFCFKCLRILTIVIRRSRNALRLSIAKLPLLFLLPWPTTLSIKWYFLPLLFLFPLLFPLPFLLSLSFPLFFSLSLPLFFSLPLQSFLANLLL